VPTFDGNTYDHEADHDRLAAQLRRVYLLMLDDEWHTLAEIARRTNDPQTSVSSRLRDLRKEKFGAQPVDYAEIRLERLPYSRVDQGIRSVVKKALRFRDV